MRTSVAQMKHTSTLHWQNVPWAERITTLRAERRHPHLRIRSINECLQRALHSSKRGPVLRVLSHAAQRQARKVQGTGRRKAREASEVWGSVIRQVRACSAAGFALAEEAPHADAKGIEVALAGEVTLGNDLGGDVKRCACAAERTAFVGM